MIYPPLKYCQLPPPPFPNTTMDVFDSFPHVQICILIILTEGGARHIANLVYPAQQGNLTVGTGTPDMMQGQVVSYIHCSLINYLISNTVFSQSNLVSLLTNNSLILYSQSYLVSTIQKSLMYCICSVFSLTIIHYIVLIQSWVSENIVKVSITVWFCDNKVNIYLLLSELNCSQIYKS